MRVGAARERASERGSRSSLLLQFDRAGFERTFGKVLANDPMEADTRVDPDAFADLLVGNPGASTAVPGSGRAALHRLDDLFLQFDPSSVTGGQTVVIDTRGGPTGNFAGFFAVEFAGTPLNYFIAFGTFDAAGIWSIDAVVPPGIAGFTITLRSYAIGFNGKVVDSQDSTITFQ